MTQYILLASLVTSFGIGAEPKITLAQKGEQFELSLPPSATAALKKAFPGFTLWNTSDFHPSGLKLYVKEARPNVAPFALVKDFNLDKVPDAIITGHDPKNELVLGVLSNGKGYKVVKISENPYAKKRPVRNWEGVKHTGLLLLLGPSERGFNLSYPQTDDELSHGSSTDYVFEDGKFEEHYQAL